MRGAQEHACTRGERLAVAGRRSERWIDWHECRGAAARGVDGQRALTMETGYGAGALVGAGEARGGQEGSSPSFWVPTLKKLKERGPSEKVSRGVRYQGGDGLQGRDSTAFGLQRRLHLVEHVHSFRLLREGTMASSPVKTMYGTRPWT